MLYSTYNIIFQQIGIHTFIIGKRTKTTTTTELLKIIIYLTSNFSFPNIIPKCNKFSIYIIYYNKLCNSSQAKLVGKHCVLADFLPDILTLQIIYLYIYISIYISIYINIYIYIYIYIYMYIYIYKEVIQEICTSNLYINLYILQALYIYICVYIYVCVYIYMYKQLGKAQHFAQSTLVTSVVLCSLTRVALMSPGKGETHVCGYVYISVYLYITYIIYIIYTLWWCLFWPSLFWVALNLARNEAWVVPETLYSL